MASALLRLAALQVNDDLQRARQLATELDLYRKKYRLKLPLTKSRLQKRPKLMKLLKETVRLVTRVLIFIAPVPPGYKRVFCTRRWHVHARRYLYARDYGYRCWSFLVPIGPRGTPWH